MVAFGVQRLLTGERAERLTRTDFQQSQIAQVCRVGVLSQNVSQGRCEPHWLANLPCPVARVGRYLNIHRLTRHRRDDRDRRRTKLHPTDFGFERFDRCVHHPRMKRVGRSQFPRSNLLAMLSGFDRRSKRIDRLGRPRHHAECGSIDRRDFER